jgi:hypothetical protein
VLTKTFKLKERENYNLPFQAGADLDPGQWVMARGAAQKSFYIYVIFNKKSSTKYISVKKLAQTTYECSD